ncbi:MAG TPA: flavodoxin domain-containing protein [Anaerolineales bacterium]|nr:flavodoxin domain-containing protein [Anaerolineales bacterium]
MNRHILVRYATRAGSTLEIAEVIGEVLYARNFIVDIWPVNEKLSIKGYGAIVMGSCIRGGGWLPEMVRFIRENKTQLNKIPIATFTVHVLNRGDDENSRAARETYMAPIREMISPVYEAFFAGKVDFSTLSLLDFVSARALQPQVAAHSGDFRDWDKVRSWAQTLFSQKNKIEKSIDFPLACPINRRNKEPSHRMGVQR